MTELSKQDFAAHTTSPPHPRSEAEEVHRLYNENRKLKKLLRNGGVYQDRESQKHYMVHIEPYDVLSFTWTSSTQKGAS